MVVETARRPQPDEITSQELDSQGASLVDSKDSTAQSVIKEALTSSMSRVRGLELEHIPLADNEDVKVILNERRSSSSGDVIAWSLVALRGEPTEDTTNFPHGLRRFSVTPVVEVALHSDQTAEVSFFQRGNEPKAAQWISLDAYAESMGDKSVGTISLITQTETERRNALSDRVGVGIDLAYEHLYGSPLEVPPRYVPLPDWRPYTIVPPAVFKEPDPATVELPLDGVGQIKGVRASHGAEPKTIKIEVSTTEPDGNDVWVDMGTHEPRRKVEGPPVEAITNVQMEENAELARSRVENDGDAERILVRGHVDTLLSDADNRLQQAGYLTNIGHHKRGEDVYRSITYSWTGDERTTVFVRANQRNQIQLLVAPDYRDMDVEEVLEYASTLREYAGSEVELVQEDRQVVRQRDASVMDMVVNVAEVPDTDEDNLVHVKLTRQLQSVIPVELQKWDSYYWPRTRRDGTLLKPNLAPDTRRDLVLQIVNEERGFRQRTGAARVRLKSSLWESVDARDVLRMNPGKSLLEHGLRKLQSQQEWRILETFGQGTPSVAYKELLFMGEDNSPHGIRVEAYESGEVEVLELQDTTLEVNGLQKKMWAWSSLSSDGGEILEITVGHYALSDHFNEKNGENSYTNGTIHEVFSANGVKNTNGHAKVNI